jgi:hypothetical protein
MPILIWIVVVFITEILEEKLYIQEEVNWE